MERRGETTRWKLPARRTGRPAKGKGVGPLPLLLDPASATAVHALDASVPPAAPAARPPPPPGRELERSRRGESTRWKERARRTGVPHAGGGDGPRCEAAACEQLVPTSPIELRDKASCSDSEVWSLSEREAIARP